MSCAANQLAANGFNVVRLGVIWAGVEPQPGVYDAAYVDSIRQTVDMLAAHGIYTIIDMIETAENVWSDSAVCAMTDHDLQGKIEDSRSEAVEA
mgnify:CR=1 FL=1